MSGEMSSRQDKNRTLIEQTKETRFQPGQSGNPGGRPKDSLTALLKQEGYEIDADDVSNREKVAKVVWELAKKGKEWAVKLAFEREDGRVPETHKIEADWPGNIFYKQVGDATKQEEG